MAYSSRSGALCMEAEKTLPRHFSARLSKQAGSHGLRRKILLHQRFSSERTPKRRCRLSMPIQSEDVSESPSRKKYSRRQKAYKETIFLPRDEEQTALARCFG